VLMALPGIPLLYSGDENAMLNDYSYRSVPDKKDDSRWVHRIPFHKTTTDDVWLSDKQQQIHDAIRDAVKNRKREKLFGHADITFHEIQNEHVFGFSRHNGSGQIHVAANFSEQDCTYYIGNTAIHLGPYDVVTLKENI